MYEKVEIWCAKICNKKYYKKGTNLYEAAYSLDKKIIDVKYGFFIITLYYFKYNDKKYGIWKEKSKGVYLVEINEKL